MLPHGGGLVVAMPAQQMGNLSPGHVSPNRMTSPVQNPGLSQQKMLGQPSNTKVALQNMLSSWTWRSASTRGSWGGQHDCSLQQPGQMMQQNTP